MSINTTISAQFATDGYILQPSVFSAEEIKLFRQKVYDQYAIDESAGLTFQLTNTSSKARYAKGCLLSKILLRDILLEPRILRFAQEIVGTEKLIYFGDSSYQIGTGLRGFHRDCIDRVYNSGPDWQSKYTLLRIGLYLQDHSDQPASVRENFRHRHDRRYRE
jgi:hypothetical protein